MTDFKIHSFSALSLSILRLTEVETVSTFMRLLGVSLEIMDGVWCERPYLVIAGMRFQTCKRVIPVVELYYVLNRPFQDGAYKAIPSDIDCGYYNYCRIPVRYRLRPFVYRKKVQKLIISEVQNIVKKQFAYLPADVSKVRLTESSTSFTVHFKFNNGECLGVALTPAIAGIGLPEGTNNLLEDIFEEDGENERVEPKWFLIPPSANNKLNPFSWELVLPCVCDQMKGFPELLPPILLLTYVAEVRQWEKLGLQVPHQAIMASALSMGPANVSLASTAPLPEQLMLIFERLIAAVRAGELLDFCVPGRNYISGLSRVQRLRLEVELGQGLKHLTTVDRFLETYVGEAFPMPLPELVPEDSNEMAEPINTERSTQSDFFHPIGIADAEVELADGEDMENLGKPLESSSSELDLLSVDSEEDYFKHEKSKQLFFANQQLLTWSLMFAIIVMILVICFAVGFSAYTDNLNLLPWGLSDSSDQESPGCDSDVRDQLPPHG